jgi:cysteinyl-tRNA synthetase
MTMSHDLNGNSAGEGLAAENVRLREEVARLQGELGGLKQAESDVKRLEQEKAEIAAERDDYLKSLYYLTRKDWTVTEEEIADADKNDVRFDERFIEELERDLRSSQKLTTESDFLKTEMTRLQSVVVEREQTIQSLYALLEEVAGFSPEELANLEKDGASLDGVIKELAGLKP